MENKEDVGQGNSREQSCQASEKLYDSIKRDLDTLGRAPLISGERESVQQLVLNRLIVTGAADATQKCIDDGVLPKVSFEARGIVQPKVLLERLRAAPQPVENNSSQVRSKTTGLAPL
ncbi:MAG: hypothetical protein IPP97_13950 [Candidatus Obscuribacter sp.]|jgi:hypothetical protein|nr:hypothetical protein [Candidatus Obscuribacter sp.]